MRLLVAALLAASLVALALICSACQDGEGAETPTATPTITTTPAPEATPTPEQPPTLEASPSPATGRVQALVTRVVDGDTIEIEGDQRVRYIGINTPEVRQPIECFGLEASARNWALTEGKVVELERDVSETDKYGRLLRYVYVDGQMVNELLVREGYARISTYPPDVKYADLFLAAQQEARDANRGLWSACLAQAPSPTGEAPLPEGGGFTVPACASTDCDCKDFASHAHAQWFYETQDPGNRHRLDGDNDGIACESLP